MRIRPVPALLLAALAAAAFAPGAHAAVTWCGTPSAVDVKPDVAGGDEIHVVYAIPSDGDDRFGSMSSAIASDVESMDAWWRSQDPTRAPRWDIAYFPGCATRFGDLDISSVRLPGSSSSYASLGADDLLHTLSRDLSAGFSPSGAFSTMWKKYLVYYDGPVTSSDICGISPVYPSSGGPLADSFVFLRASDCPVSYGEGRGGAVVALHELVHNLGAVSALAPNTCPDHPGHVCDNPSDLLYWQLTGDLPLSSELLDYGHDDYYAHSGSWWDVQDSTWLRRPLEQRTLALTSSGPGSVRLSEGVAGYETTCAGGCATEWDAGAQVTLEALPEKGYGLSGWNGACSGRDAECSLVVASSESADAGFAKRVTLRLLISGRGQVRSTLDSFRCLRRACIEPLLAGDELELAARPAKGWKLARWSGSCHGRGLCQISVGERDPQVSAAFERRGR
ncbi:MAG: InlB B-repeat-containing protein [Gaiellaceae bacterium]